MKVFTARQMREFDARATNEYSIPSIVLMENAALRVVEFLEWKFAPLHEKKIVVLCGKGNNGGDGLAIARHLANCGVPTEVILAFSPKDFTGDALTNYRALRYCGVDIMDGRKLERADSQMLDEMPFPFSGLSRYILIDALLGTGFRSTKKKNKTLRIGELLARMSEKIIAVDIPSGLDAQSGEAAPDALTAHYTVALTAPKPGMLLRDGIEKCGEIWVGDIGASGAIFNFEFDLPNSEKRLQVLTTRRAQCVLPHRSIDAHKGTAGKVVVVGGSRGMSGAPILASTAALRTGAGLCVAAIPDRVLDVFAASVLEATSRALPCDNEGRLVANAANELPTICRGADVCALGPGLSRSDGALNFARRVVRECDLPLVIDADALYGIRSIAESVKARTAPTILTPHSGEMAELMKSDAKTVNENRLETAIACAQQYNAIVVLKGARSIVATPDGDAWLNLTGNAGMATGGSGDVLTGTIAGLLAQTKNALDATLLGVYVHGLAGDIEYSKCGNGLIAHDIAHALPAAMLDLGNRPHAQSINGRLHKLE